ncbi:Piso0_004200 [Millerozyma farinosa CBS 7064]|uniref:Piso0_004200 protein n=1 Tax=Pichia sorbitophila (strain ATCC MYA-4447 / BCRC 22081 / CBS 7064 / NBRC 10061 / NRRL Y-12695) TaxID=559304 RepID=G8Y7R7_PICSO|nr:Piso0_004200 [Millerozyma farinosa CBS 7064]CCE84647.1 Piso0_004200 [Millerozyma farinosa CBS 7064]
MDHNSNGGGSHQSGHTNNQRRRHNQSQKPDGPKREAILDLNKYTEKKIRVKFIGGRQIIGELKGFDQLMNLVLKNVEETLRDPEDDHVLTKEKRNYDLVVVRGPSLLTISPLDGSGEIENPFAQSTE